MSIRKEINAALKGLCKKAQAHGFMPTTGNEQIDAWTNLANVHLLRGVARGVKEAIPGLVDGLVGVPAGLINGLGTGLGTKLSGGSFTKGFGEGFDDSTSFAKRYYSDPIRRAEMAVGGNGVKRLLSGAQKYHQGVLEKSVGTPTDFMGYPREPYWKYRKALADLASMEDGVAVGSELMATIPTAIGSVGKMGKIPAAISAAGVGVSAASDGALSWRDAAKVRYNDLAKSIRTLHDGADSFWKRNPEIAPKLQEP